jgi:hypothetical protein
VPLGLGMITAAQRALADFLRLDDDLLVIAAHTSPPLEEVADDPDDLAAWVNRLPVIEKNRLLGRVVQGEAARVRMEMLRRFHGDRARSSPPYPAGPWPICSTTPHGSDPIVSVGWLPSAPKRRRDGSRPVLWPANDDWMSSPARKTLRGRASRR